MTSQADGPFRGSLRAQYAFIAVTICFGAAVLIQVFLAGEASLVAPDEWQTHVTWVHIFQWLSLALPPMAYWASRRIGYALLNGLPIVIIGLQYMFIHGAINHAWPVLAGLHAIDGLLLFAFAVYVVQAWRQSASLDRTA